VGTNRLDGNDPLLSAKGNYPYRKRKKGEAFAPVTSNMCIHCGLCATDCPVQVIAYDDVTKINAENCLHCCRCIKVCPTQAKKLEHPFIKGLSINSLTTVAMLEKYLKFLSKNP